MLAIGAKAPDFTLPDHAGEPVSLASLLALGPLVVFFYPGDFTPVCSAQACLFREMHELATRAGVRVVGINPGSSRSHAAFRSVFKLPYRLLSDRGGRVARAYGAMGLLGMMPRRVTYLISADGVIADRVEASLRMSRHREFLTRVIESQASRGAPAPE